MRRETTVGWKSMRRATEIVLLLICLRLFPYFLSLTHSLAHSAAHAHSVSADAL